MKNVVCTKKAKCYTLLAPLCALITQIVVCTKSEWGRGGLQICFITYRTRLWVFQRCLIYVVFFTFEDFQRLPFLGKSFQEINSLMQIFDYVFRVRRI